MAETKAKKSAAKKTAATPAAAEKKAAEARSGSRSGFASTATTEKKTDKTTEVAPDSGPVMKPPSSLTSPDSAPNEKDLDNDPRFKFGPPLIQTPQDAQFAYLRGQINEDEFRSALGRFGTLPGDLATIVQIPTERPDAAFHRQIPDDLMTPVLPPEESLKVHLKKVNEKAAIREEATRRAEGETIEETVARESNPEFRNELEAKHITDPLEDVRGKDGKLTAGARSEK